MQQKADDDDIENVEDDPSDGVQGNSDFLYAPNPLTVKPMAARHRAQKQTATIFAASALINRRQSVARFRPNQLNPD